MLNEKRIKEAEANVKRYLEEGLLKKISKIDENIQQILRKNSEESLRIADLLFKGEYICGLLYAPTMRCTTLLMLCFTLWAIKLSIRFLIK